MTHGGLPSRVGTRVLLCVCVVSWVGGGGPALGGTVEWLRGGARGACRQVCVVGVAVHGLSLYVGGWSWYAADAGGPRSGRLSRVLSCTVRILMSYVLCVQTTHGRDSTSDALSEREIAGYPCPRVPPRVLGGY